MHKAFRIIERNQGEGHRDFYERVFQEAGSDGDFYASWKAMSQVVNEGYESPYTFGRIMRQELGDDNAVIYRYNPSNVYLSFHQEDRRAVLYVPALRDEEEESPIRPIRANGSGPVRDWYDAADTLADSGATFLICDNCGQGVRPKEAHLMPSVIVEEAGVYIPVFCNDCWQKTGQVADDGAITLTCDGCGRQVSTDDAYMKLLGPEDGVLCPICHMSRQLTGQVSVQAPDNRLYICDNCGQETSQEDIKVITKGGGVICSNCYPAWYSNYKAGLPTSHDADAEEVPYICDECGREVDAAEAYVDEGVLCPDCWLNAQEDADQE